MGTPTSTAPICSIRRSAKDTSRTRVRLNNAGEATSYEPFATGWLRDGDNWGRPVDLLRLPGGALLVSDDQTGAIYRITYRPDGESNGET